MFYYHYRDSSLKKDNYVIIYSCFCIIFLLKFVYFLFQNNVRYSSLTLVWTKYNVDVFCLVWFAFRLLFLQPEIVNKTTHVLKVIHSFVHSFNRTRVCLEADRDHLFSWVWMSLFGLPPSAIVEFTSAQGGKLTCSIQSNQTRQV